MCTHDGQHIARPYFAATGSFHTVNLNELVKVVKLTSLFSSLSRNVGTFMPHPFETTEIEGVMIPPAEVIREGVD